jgi:hypothetical protein
MASGPFNSPLQPQLRHPHRKTGHARTQPWTFSRQAEPHQKAKPLCWRKIRTATPIDDRHCTLHPARTLLRRAWATFREGGHKRCNPDESPEGVCFPSCNHSSQPSADCVTSWPSIEGRLTLRRPVYAPAGLRCTMTGTQVVCLPPQRAAESSLGMMAAVTDANGPSANSVSVSRRSLRRQEKSHMGDPCRLSRKP